MGISLSPVERGSVVDAVSDRILSLIRSGELRPGDKLPSQRQLVDMLEISRPTLREALTGLTMVGYLEARVGEGYFVKELRPNEMVDFSVISSLINNQAIAQVYQARAVLESSMAELAAIYAREEDIARMRRCIRMIERAIPSGEAISGGIDFHQIVADATHNPILAEIESRVLSVIRGHILDIFSEPSSFKYDVESHERILQCIKAGDRAAARREAYEHIQKFAAELGIEMGWSPDLGDTEGD